SEPDSPAGQRQQSRLYVVTAVYFALRSSTCYDLNAAIIREFCGVSTEYVQYLVQSINKRCVAL
ncbi:hypothetical protein PybrP1_010432, partial [[Pythium] brassicae (nom. inval.)]